MNDESVAGHDGYVCNERAQLHIIKIQDVTRRGLRRLSGQPEGGQGTRSAERPKRKFILISLREAKRDGNRSAIALNRQG